jgi:glucose-1-phosphate adenylyltransferase
MLDPAMIRNTVVMVMAGGKGSRLAPLTSHRAKPAVPFGGRYRIIDFVLSNMVNSGYSRVYVLTQYMASSLIKHLSRTWHVSGFGQYIEVVPAQMRTGEYWYRGTADAVRQNLNLIRDARAEQVAVFGGDHIYKFAIDQMEAYHQARDADLTVAVFQVPRSEAKEFGVVQVDADWRIVGFQEKPSDPTPLPGNPDRCLVSMGNYFFRAPVLLERLLGGHEEDLDFGKHVIPRMVADGYGVFAYDFGTNRIPGEPEGANTYWRDVGTLDSYFQASMELRSPLPDLNLYNRRWRIRSAQRNYPPARFVRLGNLETSEVVDSLVCEGSIVQSSRLDRVVLGYDTFVRGGASVTQSVLLSGCNIGEGAQLYRVLCDKNCTIAPGTRIGLDPEQDRERFPFISEGGVVVLPKGTHVPAEGPIGIARDIADLLKQDPAARRQILEFEGRYLVGELDRHSFGSRGPRYRDASPDPENPAPETGS